MRFALLVGLQLVVGMLLTVPVLSVVAPVLPLAPVLGLLWAGLVALLYRRSEGRPPRLFAVVNLVAVGVAGLSCGYGALALKAAEASAARGGGLLGAFGLLPLALGILLVSAAGASLWLARSLARRSP